MFKPGLLSLLPSNVSVMTLTGDLPDWVSGGTYSGSLTRVGGTAPFTYSIINGALPTGLSLNSSTGAVTGTSTDVGAHAFTVQVQDATSATASHSDSITIVAFAANDEFTEAALDTVGTRFGGAQSWAWFNQSTATAALSSGSIVLTAPKLAGDNWRCILQPVPSSGAWKYQTRITGYTASANFENQGFILYNSANGHVISFGPAMNSGSIGQGIYIYHFSSFSGSGADAAHTQPIGSNQYYEVDWDGTTNFNFKYSADGSTFTNLLTEAMATYLGGITHIGLGVESNNTSANGVLTVDWFRRTA